LLLLLFTTWSTTYVYACINHGPRHIYTKINGCNCVNDSIFNLLLVEEISTICYYNILSNDNSNLEVYIR